ncbi:uncharacterized protein LOC118113400 isoform X2 [Hippoglossus stenolepis]|uniref:uncharacterized protein LOC118113400 isoform X2 n=1 Tax=Hippoglossus stenolepis TaxID=195615 RepID=UPI00159CBDAD|nr:uncharacterized protein LOC118113400 isoform X2 [Hippoglossus stenolepis]
MLFDSFVYVFESGRVFGGQDRRSGWVRAGLYKKVEHSTEGSLCSSSSSVFWHLLGFSAWPGSRRSNRPVGSGFLWKVLSHSRSSLTPTPHRIRRNDHQTGPADTWILPPPPEASCRRGADAATGPCREPDRHDAGHHGPESVLLQCQTDDGEGPACTLNRLDSLIVEMDEPMRREGDGGRRREGSAVSFRTALFSPHCHSHTRTLNFWYPSLTIRRDVRAAF